MTTLKVTIGIVLYQNDLDLLYKTFLGVREQIRSCCNFEIHVVILDNDRGGQVEAVKSLADRASIDLAWIGGGENIGFGAAHNDLFERSKVITPMADYYLCMNPDGVPHRLMIDTLLQFSQSKSDKGIFEAKQFPVEHPKFYDIQNFKTSWCSGCCLLFPSSIYEELGGFDDLFFLYCEDVDISWRTQLLGYDCYTVPGAFFYHYVFGKDRNITRQEIEMTISTYKLAMKYGHQQTAKQEISRLTNLVSIDRLKAVLNCDINPIVEDSIPNYIDFSNGRYFGQARW
jgi:N-acetylglucosaminyl-diphospho-decaprenol L-rhamnosyltransferase